MTLYDMLDKTIVDQEVWIFEHNAYDQNMPLFRGNVWDARADQETVWMYLMCEVDYYVCSYNILDIRVNDKYYEERLEGHYGRSDKWGKNKGERPWLYSMEIDEEKRMRRNA
jgi:hypothetical protein